MKQYKLEVSALPEKLCEIRGFIEPLVAECGFNEEQVFHIVLAVDEACSNVIRHAYGSKNDKKDKILLNVEVDVNKIKIKIKDYGIKCDPSNICGRKLEDVKPGGLGVHLMHGCMDKVYFNTELQDSNEIILVKNFN